jgi:hypothetical protein
MTQRLKPLRGDASKLLKLVIDAEDVQTLEQALELGHALGQPADGLLEGIEVTASGELLPSSRFRGSQANQPALNLLLMQQLSMALEGSPEASLRSAVRHLNLVCQIPPVLRGFDGLESLTIHMLEGTQWRDLSNWGAFPSLRSFSVTQATSKEQPCKLESLDGLNAPNLEVLHVQALGLTCVKALANGSCLSDVDLSDNTKLASIDGLKPSSPSLQTLKLEACHDLQDIAPLEGASALVSINLKGCVRLRSLQPLAASKSLNQINLEGCSQIESLQGLAGSELAPWRYGIFSLEGCAALTSLEGLPTLSKETSSLCLEQMPALVSLSGIQAARSIEKLEIGNTALTHLGGLEDLLSLVELRVIDCNDLKDISVLGQLQKLSQARFYDCSQIQCMPTQWGHTLRNLELTGGNFSALGELPKDLEQLEVRGVATLHDLQGVEKATALKFVAIDTFMKNADALQGLPKAFLRCFEAPGRPLNAAWLQAVAGRLKPLRLDLGFSNLKDLQVLLEFPQLQAVHVGHHARELYELKVGEHLTEAAVRTLQRVICKKHKLTVPDFLKARRTSTQAVVEGGPSLADLKRGLSSTDFSEILEALNKLRATGSAALYDAIVEGVYGPQLYNGDTKALGKVFKDILAPYRPWARWALTHILMDAPDDATSAVAIRDQLESITLTVSLSYGQDPSRPLPLARFKSLQSITLEGMPGNDLSFLREAGPLQSMTLLEMKDLTSFETLASMKSLTLLQSLTVKQCPALVSLQGLESAAHLNRLVVEGSDLLGDFSAMNGMRSLQGFPGRYHRVEVLDFSNFKSLCDIQFAAGLESAKSLQFKLTGRVDLSPLAGLKNLISIKLELDTLEQDFSPLSNLRELDITLIDPKTGYTLSPTKKPKPAHQYRWSGEFPQLEKLEVSGGLHDMSQLLAPRLNSFESSSRMPSLRGVGHASNIRFQMSECESLDGLEESPIESLDIYYSAHDFKSVPSVKILQKLPRLNKLRIGSGLTDLHVKELTGCANIQRLETANFTGSLAFLKGWTQLTFLDLQNSGELSSMETLCDLPSLTEIRLRGSAMKRETWPKALQDRLVFRS